MEAAALAIDALQKLQNGRLALETPPTRAPAPPCSSWIRSSGFTALAPLCSEIRYVLSLKEKK